MTVGVFNGALFPCGIGVGVIDLQQGIDPGKEGFDFSGIQELTSIVGGDGEDFLHLSASDKAAEGTQDFDLVDAPELDDQVEAGFAFDQDQQPAFAMDAGDDGVHLPVAELGPPGKIRPLLNGQVVGLWKGAPESSAAIFAALGMVWGFAVEDPDVAVFDMGVDAAEGGDVGEPFVQEILASMGGRFAFLFDLDGQESGQDVGETHAPALVLRTGLNVVLSDVLGILPIFLVVVEAGTWGETPPDLPAQRAVWKADPDRQLPKRKALECGELKVAVIRHGDLLAVFESKMLAGDVVEGIFSGHWEFFSSVGWFRRHPTCKD